MFLIVPATFGTSASALHRHLAEEPSLPRSVEGASKLALLAAKALLAVAFLVGLASTILASA